MAGQQQQTAPGDDQLKIGREAIRARAGCYLVDYSFVETKALRDGYVRDDRVYDVNREKSVKEWIVAEDLSPTRIKLQHVLFATDLNGKLKEGSVLKHTGEDWQFNAPFLYDYAGSSIWNVKDLKSTPNLWTRRITNLDDGLRYQCAAAFKGGMAYADWSCENYAPIPGRETRDMGRKDYQALQRISRVITYDSNWLERENNTKTIDGKGARMPLVKEFGKTWYVRLPDAECSNAQAFAKQRMPFWLLANETWDQVLTGDRAFAESPKPARPSRYEKISELEDQYANKNLSEPGVRKEARDKMLTIIQQHRVDPPAAAAATTPAP